MLLIREQQLEVLLQGFEFYVSNQQDSTLSHSIMFEPLYKSDYFFVVILIK